MAPKTHLCLSGTSTQAIADAAVMHNLADRAEVSVVGDCVYLSREAWSPVGWSDAEATEFAAQLAQVPFELMSTSALHPSWAGDGYLAPSFGDRHIGHGWAAAFRGAGHGRLVSRRWLPDRPWTLIEAGQDTSLVLFHDLDASADDALEQARVGHHLMGISDAGGFIQSDHVFGRDLEGFYDADTQTLRVFAAGRVVPPGELLDLRAAVALQALGPDRPLEGAAVVFVSPDEARVAKSDLWRYEIACVTLVDGRHVSL